MLANASSIGNNSIENITTLKTAYIPNCTSLGTTALNNFVFGTCPSFLRIYAHPSLATNNGGGEDGDLAYARGRGASVNYVTNFTSPITPTIASVGIIYGTAIQLIDEGISTNAIDYFEVTVNGVYIGWISVNSYITGLTPSTNYTITLKAVDILYNKSVGNNSINVSTNAVSAVPTTGLVSYYKLDSNSNDSYGSNHGADTSITYVSGKVGNAANFDGTNSYVVIPDSNSLSFTNGTNDLPFSVSFWIKLTATGFKFIMAKTGGGVYWNNTGEWSIINNNGNISLYLANKTSGRLSNDFATGLVVGNWYHVVITYSGSGINAGMKLYLNGSEKGYGTNNGGTYTSMSNTARTLILGQEAPGSGSYKLNGILEEVAIYNVVLTKSQVELLYNLGTGITL